MKVIAFLQLRNENETGNLVRCLENCKKWSDEIFLYDDCSDDGSQEIYLKYTNKKNIIFGTKRQFQREQFIKQQLLELALKSKPDWIGWIDGDVTLDRYMTTHCKDYLAKMERDVPGVDAIRIHNLNLWRHPAFYRTDNRFNGLKHTVFWKNTGKLHYKPNVGLHGRQYPQGLTKVIKHKTSHIIHYGFASKLSIVKKYLTYKSFGQKGWALDRLIDESTLKLVKTPKDWYPIENIPENYDSLSAPTKINFETYKKYKSWEDYKHAMKIKRESK